MSMRLWSEPDAIANRSKVHLWQTVEIDFYSFKSNAVDKVTVASRVLLSALRLLLAPFPYQNGNSIDFIRLLQIRRMEIHYTSVLNVTV